MKKLVLGLIVGAALGALVTWWAVRPGSREAAEPAAAKGPEEPAAQNPLQLTPERQAAAGITLAAPRTVELPPEVDAFGRVLDPTPFVALVAEEATARASLAASEKELERVKKLFAAGGNASAQAVETAEAAAVRDRAAVASAHARLLAGWGATLAEHADLATVQDTLAQGAALIRIDLLPGQTLSGNPESARVALLGTDQEYEVQVLGAAPVADPQVQGPSYLALLRGHTLPSGATLRVKLTGAGEPTKALVVPRTAIVYHEGSAWLFVLEKQAFERRLVQLGRTIDGDVVVAHGVGADDRVAVTGAQQLLSAELVTGGSPDER